MADGQIVTLIIWLGLRTTAANYYPYSTCCSYPVYVVIDYQGNGQILCGNRACSQKILQSFEISYDKNKNKYTPPQRQNQHWKQLYQNLVSKQILRGCHRQNKNILREVVKSHKGISKYLNQNIFCDEDAAEDGSTVL